MSLSALLEGHPEVLGALIADRRGQPRGAGAGAAAPADEAAAAMAVALAELSRAGDLLGLQRLEVLRAAGERQASVSVVRGDAFLLAAVDPRRSGAAEKLLEGWSPEAPPQRPPPLPRPAASAPATPTTPAAAVAAAPPAPALRAEAPAPTLRAEAPAATPAPRRPIHTPPGAIPRPSLLDGPWPRLRRALVRGQLTEAYGLQAELDAPAAGGASSRPGAEPLPAAERERVLGQLLDGIGCVLAGDGVAGGRILREVGDPAQPNLSFRWLALHWGVRAAVRSGAFQAAGAAVKEALAISKRLDEEAFAITQLAIGEVLSHGKDVAQALPWLGEARGRLQRLEDGWGAGQACMAQARVLAQLGREGEAAEAARQACAGDPSWEEPPVFLARRALIRGDLAAAEELLQGQGAQAAERVRAVIEAVRQGAVSLPDAGDYLREHDAPASARSIRTLERIARASPRFSQARDALAWMLVKVGRYADAATIFRGLLAADLAPADRASVMLGLGCIANADRSRQAPGAGLRAAVSVAASAPASSPGPEPAPLPALGSSLVLPTAGALGGGATVFSGSLSVFALPDLLEFLRAGRRTGLLVCSSPRGMGALRFSEGRVTGAASPASGRLGEVLVEDGRVAAEALRAAAERLGGEPSDQLLCEHLLREGLVEGPVLEEALRRQVGLAIRELLQWKDGEFAFDREEDGDTGHPESPISVDVQGALMRVFQELDEGARGAPAQA